jgi:hypothetical protein
LEKFLAKTPNPKLLQSIPGACVECSSSRGVLRKSKLRQFKSD